MARKTSESSRKPETDDQYIDRMIFINERREDPAEEIRRRRIRSSPRSTDRNVMWFGSFDPELREDEHRVNGRDPDESSEDPWAGISIWH